VQELALSSKITEEARKYEQFELLFPLSESDIVHEWGIGTHDPINVCLNEMVVVDGY